MEAARKYYYHHRHYTVKVKQTKSWRKRMAIGNITAGTTGSFAAQLELNGAPIPLPSGSTFAWSASDPAVSLVVSADTLSVVISVPAGDQGTSVSIAAAATAPNGKVVTGTLSVALTPIPQVFTVTVSQTA
jgi:hypothetical protein